MPDLVRADCIGLQLMPSPASTYKSYRMVLTVASVIRYNFYDFRPPVHHLCEFAEIVCLKSCRV